MCGSVIENKGESVAEAGTGRPPLGERRRTRGWCGGGGVLRGRGQGRGLGAATKRGGRGGGNRRPGGVAGGGFAVDAASGGIERRIQGERAVAVVLEAVAFGASRRER